MHFLMGMTGNYLSNVIRIPYPAKSVFIKDIVILSKNSLFPSGLNSTIIETRIFAICSG